MDRSYPSQTPHGHRLYADVAPAADADTAEGRAQWARGLLNQSQDVATGPLIPTITRSLHESIQLIDGLCDSINMAADLLTGPVPESPSTHNQTSGVSASAGGAVGELEMAARVVEVRLHALSRAVGRLHGIA